MLRKIMVGKNYNHQEFIIITFMTSVRSYRNSYFLYFFVFYFVHISLTTLHFKVDLRVKRKSKKFGYASVGLHRAVNIPQKAPPKI